MLEACNPTVKQNLEDRFISSDNFILISIRMVGFKIMTVKQVCYDQKFS